MTDLEIAFAALSAKQAPYNTLWSYYDGNHPLEFSVARLQEVFKSAQTKFVENWCSVVVDAVLERIALRGLGIANDDAATARMAELWTLSNLGIDADDAHLAALVTGEAFVIVWPDDVTDEVQAYYNDPRLCYAHYNHENRNVMRFAAKWWMTEAQTYRMNLYYPERIEYYETGKMSHAPTAAKAFKATTTEPATNPYGQIPVFHLRPERRAIISTLDDAIPLQAAINKLLADMMVTSEFGTFPQRWIISNSDTETLKNGPNEIWTIPSGDGVGQPSSTGQFPQADLDCYLKPIDNLVAAISAITRTPAHYFFSRGGEISGEALIALEAPLNKKVARYIGRFYPVWQQIGAFMMRLDSGREIPWQQVAPAFDAPETVQPMTRSQIRQANVNAGMPLTTVLRDEGKSEAYLEQLEADKIAEQAASQESLARALVEQQRRFDQGETA